MGFFALFVASVRLEGSSVGLEVLYAAAFAAGVAAALLARRK